MYNIKGSNPTKLYFMALNELVEKGEVCSPRGKLVKELRPAAVEFTNPYNRVTFLGGRRINPFFQIAESLWILSGRADVAWLTQFNANMATFSDDGVWFNAPYGERIRSWGKNSAHNIIINPVDQMVDVYNKLLSDKDTRQAVIVISNPSFDNSAYTIKQQGKDIACNLVITFKIRDDKLHMTVFNRSNDVNWGLFGANLCQFTTIQETLLNWLKFSGQEGFANLEMGEYCQMTDSLHVYLDEYGAKCTTDVLEYYQERPKREVSSNFECTDEPRMSMNVVQFDKFLTTYWNLIDPYISSNEFMSNHEQRDQLMEFISQQHEEGVIDDYWYFGIKAMIAYRLVKMDMLVDAMEIISTLAACQWKISMLYFLKNFIYKVGRDEMRADEYDSIVKLYTENAESCAKSLTRKSYAGVLKNYLKL